MINFEFNQYCYGCGACENICPVNAIDMMQNEEGFQIPKIDKEKCIGCGKCDKVCPHVTAKIDSEQYGEVKGIWLYASVNDNAKMRSSSGAACYELSKAMIKQDGYFSGCIWNEELVAIHTVSNEESMLQATQGSKYVQSIMCKSYEQIVELLKVDKKVIFTGTPCQATAVHNYVNCIENGRYRDNLITLAVICHGVASPLAWETYKKWAGEEQRSPLVKVNFRDKSKEGYKKSYCRYEHKNGTVIYLPTYLPSSKYIEATLVYNLAMRNSCAHCECKGINMGIDIIVGDWYAENKGEGKHGTSCIVAFTEQGKTYVEENLDNLREFSYKQILERNGFIEKSITSAPNRKKFFENIRDYHYWSNVEELYPEKYKYKKFLVKIGMYDFVKKFIN